MGKIPNNIPEGWETNLNGITRTELYGLHAVCSVEEIVEDDPPLPPGEYMHMSISRPYQTPGWRECGRYVWGSGLFDEERPIIVILWPTKEASQGFDNVFHFWQKMEVKP